MSNNKLLGCCGRFCSALEVMVNKCFYASVDKNLYRISAICLYLLTKTINRNHGRKRILYIGSLASLYDINAMVAKSNRLQYLHLPRFYFGYILRKYIQYNDLKEATYHVDSKFLAGKEETYKHILAMFDTLKKLIKFDAVMTSNFGYLQQQELLRITREKCVPVIVLYKEGLGNQWALDKLVKSYRPRKSQCDLFICYNEKIKSTLLERQIEGLSDEKICVTGIPRLDFYLDRRTQENSNQITFFSFLPEFKFGRIAEDEKTIQLVGQKVKMFHEFVFRYAMEHPACQVVIKTKPSEREMSYVADIAYKYLCGHPIPENLIITNTGDAMDYILQSHCVLGGNSTVLLEALLAGKVIATIDFDEFFDHNSWSLFCGYEECIVYLSSYEELVEFVENRNQPTKFDDKLMDALFTRFIYRPDGKASVRVEDRILQLFK